MSDFDFRTEIKKRIPQKLQATVFSEKLNINIMQQDNISKDGFIIGGDYNLSDNFSHLKVDLTTALHGVEDKPVIRVYSVVKKINGTKTERAKNAEIILGSVLN